MKTKAIFLDRDGVINIERGEYTFLPEDFTLNDGLIERLKRFQEEGFLLIMISNQGGISRGIYTKNHVEVLHENLKKKLAEQDIELTEIYYCPHHSDIENCLCRKPKNIMLEKAVARFNIDVKLSYMIGDSQRDVDAAESFGIKGIKIRPNHLSDIDVFFKWQNK